MVNLHRKRKLTNRLFISNRSKKLIVHVFVSECVCVRERDINYHRPLQPRLPLCSSEYIPFKYFFGGISYIYIYIYKQSDLIYKCGVEL